MPVDEDRLRKESVYESQAPLGSIAADLNDVERIASGWRTARKRLQIAGIVSLLLGLVSLAVSPPAGICLAAVGIGLLFWVKRYNKGVAAGLERCEVVRKVTDMLARDTAAQQAVKIRLAFDPKREMISEIPLPHRRNGKQRLYKVAWFSTEACLLDGTTFSETIEDLVRERSFKNPRGKSKTKTRTRSIVAARFDYPAKVYGNVTPLAERLQKEIHLPASAVVKQFVAGERNVKVKALVTKAEELGETTPMLALGVYRMLNLSRKLVARAARQRK
jgi:hypothetical protein